MNRKHIVVAGSLLVFLSAGTLLLQEDAETTHTLKGKPDTAAKTVTGGTLPEQHAATATEEAEILSEEQMALLDDPRVIRFSRDLEFQSRVRAFFEQADSLSDETRAQRAAAIEDQLESYRAEGKVSGPEALLLRLALARTLETDPQQQEAASRAVIREYRREAEQRMAQWHSRHQPEFAQYKQREQTIVEEVMAMDTIPGGMERNEYLRQRLQRAREEAMSKQ